MSESKKSDKANELSEKSERDITKKRAPTVIKPSKKSTALRPAKSQDLWQAFNDTFERFRSDFADLLIPERWTEMAHLIPQTRVPAIDLEDCGNEYILRAEMPGFKKEDIEIEVQDNSIAITGYAGWKYDEKGKLYICKERACETFYREVELPEEIQTENVKANLTGGVLDIALPKKAPKQKRKVAIK
jgi:HSP20 family protein